MLATDGSERPQSETRTSSTIIVADSPYFLPAGDTVTVHNQDGLIIRTVAAARASVTISGQLLVDFNFANNFQSILDIDRLSLGDGDIKLTATAVLRIDAPLGLAAGIDAGNGASLITNEGLVDVLAKFDAEGIIRGGNSDTFGRPVVNSGTIHVVSTSREGTGVYLPAGGVLLNSGLIDVQGAQHATGLRLLESGGLTNSGTIRAYASTAGEGVAVSIEATLRDGTFVNTGSLEGDVALFFNAYGPGISTFQNSGRMIGRVELGQERQVLLNTGLIDGAVSLGSGDDTYSGSSGRATGMVSGGEGSDSLAGGAGFDNFQGNMGADTVSTAGGEDFCVGGKDNDSLSGGGDSDLVYGNLGADTCEGGGGNDIVRGGQDNDLVSGGDGDDFVSGDKGADTMTGGAGADLFHTFGDAGLDRVTDFSLAQGDRVQLDPGTVFTVSQVGADTVIDMTGGGQMILVGVAMSTLTPGWIFGA